MNREVMRLKWKISSLQMKAELYGDLIYALKQYYNKSRWRFRGKTAYRTFEKVIKMLEQKQKVCELAIKLNKERLEEVIKSGN
ncbi:MAG: hypothetical protein RMI04_09565 [Thermofilaceae archaeon]|nr:hypothetical protein [Thermofilaceae archaeon]